MINVTHFLFPYVSGASCSLLYYVPSSRSLSVKLLSDIVLNRHFPEGLDVRMQMSRVSASRHSAKLLPPPPLVKMSDKCPSEPVQKHRGGNVRGIHITEEGDDVDDVYFRKLKKLK